MLSIQSSEERASRGPCRHSFSVGRTDGGTPLDGRSAGLSDDAKNQMVVG